MTVSSLINFLCLFRPDRGGLVSPVESVTLAFSLLGVGLVGSSILLPWSAGFPEARSITTTSLQCCCIGEGRFLRFRDGRRRFPWRRMMMRKIPSLFPYVRWNDARNLARKREKFAIINSKTFMRMHLTD